MQAGRTGGRRRRCGVLRFRGQAGRPVRLVRCPRAGFRTACARAAPNPDPRVL